MCMYVHKSFSTTLDKEHSNKKETEKLENIN